VSAASLPNAMAGKVVLPVDITVVSQRLGHASVQITAERGQQSPPPTPTGPAAHLRAVLLAFLQVQA